MSDQMGSGDRQLSVTDRVRAIEQSSVRVMFDRAEAHDGDLVRLEIGEPDFDTPEHVVDAAVDAARAGDTNYTSNAGIPDLREAIADKYERDRGFRPDPASEIAVTVGGMEALHLSMLTIAEYGDEVVLPSPAWTNYFQQVQLADATPVEVPLSPDTGYDLDPDRITDAITDDTAAVLLNTPCNPTGRVYDVDDVRAVVETAADHGAYVIADEVYKGLTYSSDGQSVATYTDENNVLVVDSVSKEYAMTGWRTGWLVGPEHVISQATKIHEATTACAPTVSQRAAVAALEGPQEPAREMHAAFEERRNYVADRIADIPRIDAALPEGAFYAFLDVSDFRGGDDFEVASTLLDDYGVVLAPGSGFGEAGAGHLRLSFAASLDQLEEGFDRIESFVRDQR